MIDRMVQNLLHSIVVGLYPSTIAVLIRRIGADPSIYQCRGCTPLYKCPHIWLRVHTLLHNSAGVYSPLQVLR